MCDMIREECLEKNENFYSLVLPVFSLCLKDGEWQLTCGLNLVAAHEELIV